MRGPLFGRVACRVIREVQGVARDVMRDLVSLLHSAARHSALVVEPMELAALQGQHSRHLVQRTAIQLIGVDSHALATGPLVENVACGVVFVVQGVARDVTRVLVSQLHSAACHTALVVEPTELVALQGQHSRHLGQRTAISDSPLIPMYR